MASATKFLVSILSWHLHFPSNCPINIASKTNTIVFFLYAAKVDHTPQPHPASPTGSLPAGFGQSGSGNSHSSFSSYRDSAQQHGPLRKSVGFIGGSSGSKLGSVEPPKGQYFDRNELPARFRRAPIDLLEIEAVESGGAALFG